MFTDRNPELPAPAFSVAQSGSGGLGQEIHRQARLRTIFFLPNRIWIESEFLAAQRAAGMQGAQRALLVGGMPGGLGIA